jgi:biotin carboxyl carrier protein
MKMEHPVAAPHAGVLALRVSTGDQVEGGSVLAVIDPTED